MWCTWAWLGLALVPDAVGQTTLPESPTTRPVVCAQDDGYRGIWYANEPQNDEYKYKYAGGMSTFPAQQGPFAYYSAQANKTFFVYGGVPKGGNTSPDRRTLLIMVSCFDHATGMVPRPRIIMDKRTDDAHDNPAIMLDERGHVWVFAAAHGTARPAYIYRSVKPYDIDAFELIQETRFSYPQPWHVEGQGFVFLHTRYEGGRWLNLMTSPDGRQWSEPRLLARFGQGHYQVSWRYKNKIATAFDYHPPGKGLNARTNLYYMESVDGGRSWQTAAKEKLDVPLTAVDNKARVENYESMGRLVYLKDLNFDKLGNPVILYVLSKAYRSGPEGGRRFWATARWTGREWEKTYLVYSDHNYDTGCLYVHEDNTWDLFAPTDPGPQEYGAGGEVVCWSTGNQGRTWNRRTLTKSSPLNHNFVRRPVNAHEHFYAFWADGHARQPSESQLYFADKTGGVFLLPPEMTEEFAKPRLINAD